jgi:hypothetical protein
MNARLHAIAFSSSDAHLFLQHGDELRCCAIWHLTSSINSYVTSVLRRNFLIAREVLFVYNSLPSSTQLEQTLKTDVDNGHNLDITKM